MYTVSIVANQAIVRQQFADFLAALDYIKDTAGVDLCACTAYGDVINGRGVMMHRNGAFITLARHH